METSTRRHDLDWLRLIAIIILLFFHTGMLFNPWEWHIKNPETSVAFTWWMVWLHDWRMPLLLFISGAGTFLALRKRTPARYAGERARRLIIPLAFGMLVVVPPQIYYEHIRDYTGYASFYRTVFDFVPYPEGSFSWHHLWFIAYLFVYSLIALPFLLFIRSQRSEAFRASVAKLLSRPGGILLLPAMLILLTQVILRPYFPEETHALIDDWAYFIHYFVFFFMGIVCYSQPAIWESIDRNRIAITVACLVIMVPFYLLYAQFRGLITLPWPEDVVETIFDVTAIFSGWFWVVAVIAWGQHFLNRPHPWLKHFNEGLYPFYILHQTVIIALGYYICQLPWSIFSKFWVVSVSTLAICLVIYFLLIRPFTITRILFGMKPLTEKDRSKEKEAGSRAPEEKSLIAGR